MNTILTEPICLSCLEFADAVCERLGDDLYREYGDAIDAQLERLYYDGKTVAQATKIIYDSLG